MELITIDNANKIKQILLNNYIEGKTINLSYPSIKTEINISNVSENEASKTFMDRSMQEMSFINEEEEENIYCMKINNRNHQIYLNIGDWGYNYRIPNMHIVLGTTYNFGSTKAYFSQLELSQALEDDNSIYIVKNITKLSGEGAITRINSGLKDNRERNIERRMELINRLDGKTIPFNKSEWLIITEINKKDLELEENHNEIFFRLIKDFINYSFSIEDIIAEDKLRV